MPFAEAFVSVGVEKLWDLLSQEYELLQGVEDQVNELMDDLNLLKSFLEDANTKKHTSTLVGHCLKRVKEIVYDAEDVIEDFILKEKLRKGSGIEKRIKRVACFIPERRDMALYIGGISKRISRVIRDMQSFSVEQKIEDGSWSSQERNRQMRQTYPTDNESDFIGLEANINMVVEKLVKDDNVQVVTITGMGGLGKTTLARHVFNHEEVKHQFDGFTWVCVSQDFSRKNVWQKILVDLKPKEEEDKISKMDEVTLQREIIGLLKTSKSLIVLDDVWKKEDWDSIEPIFPPDKGWKLLLTSRNENVVARRTYFNLKPQCLTPDESWKLFRKIVIPKNDASECKVDEEMEKMGKEMIKTCGGLPLAIKVLGGLLAAKYTQHDWKRVSENIGSHLLGGRTNFNEDNTNSMNHVLSLSFEELPSYLKHCFLYLAHFPEDHLIDIEKLSYYWAAEGIFQPRHYDGETIRDVGDSYIEELVRRNMIISRRDGMTSRFETCHLHDMMREICLFKAKEENFLQFSGGDPPTAQSPCTSRRIVYQNPTGVHIGRKIKNPKLRSFVVIFPWKGFSPTGLSISSFKRLKLLRVLDLSESSLSRHPIPYGIGKLIHLRYLCFKDELGGISHLPSSIGNLILLIYLNIGGAGILNSLPNVFKGMQDLKYLELPYTHGSKKLELGNLVNLEELKNFSTKNGSLKDLHGMARLRTLSIRVTTEITMKTLYASISGLRRLENLAIYYEGIMMLEEEIKWDFVDLKNLSLCISLKKLPTVQQHFPSQLTILELYDTDLEEDPMPILEKLLKLKEMYLSGLHCVRKLVCQDGGFPQLQILKFKRLYALEEWIVEEGSMPLLHTLTIQHCPKLKEFPFITSLKELDITEYVDNSKWKENLSKGGKDYEKVKHIPSIKL